MIADSGMVVWVDNHSVQNAEPGWIQGQSVPQNIHDHDGLDSEFLN